MDGEWLSITEAAARLTAAGDPVDRSTLSRYLKQHSEALAVRPDGKSNLVEFGALKTHRAENIRLKAPIQSARLPAVPPARVASSQSEASARKLAADAEMREMDLAERRGQLVPASEVDRAGRAAIALMQASLEQALEREASSAALKYGWDERTLRIVLKGFQRLGLDEFHRQMLKSIEAMTRPEEGQAAPED